MVRRTAARLYAEPFPNRHLSVHRVFTRLHQRLRDTDSFEVNRREAGGRRRLVSLEDKERILQYFNGNSRTNTRAAANELGMRYHSIVRQTLHDNDIYSYHFQRVQELLPADFNTR